MYLKARGKNKVSLINTTEEVVLFFSLSLSVQFQGFSAFLLHKVFLIGTFFSHISSSFWCQKAKALHH